MTKNTLRKILHEAIKLDVEKGDVILTGRFKNKRRIVKTIGTDRFGQPTINGKSILKFKIEKHMPKNKMSAKTREEMNEMKLLRKTIRRMLLEQDDYIEKLNTMYASPDPDTHAQADELVEALYGDNPPPTLRRYGAYDSYMGDTLEDCLTKEEARTYHQRNDDWYPANTDGKPNTDPEYDPEYRQYAYISRAHMKFLRV